MEVCCGGCFGDWFLTDHIDISSDKTGKCDFCGEEDVKLIAPQELIYHFEPLFDLYETSDNPNARSIESLLREDWGLFEGVERITAEALLVHVFDNPDIFRGRFLPIIEDDAASILQWEAFREKLKHQWRFFPSLDDEILEDLATSFVSLVENPTPTVYRARMCEKGAPFPVGQMGKPPATLVGNGRANPVGIPCLYVASDADTAVAEIRPHKGEIVCVAEFEITQPLKLIDLRDPRRKISPFSLAERLRVIHRNMGYLCRLGSELTMPILPRSAHLDYLPSQYLCEYIRSLKYDGVIYKSAMGPGTNYAIFNDGGVVGGNVTLYKVSQVSVEANLFDPQQQ